MTINPRDYDLDELRKMARERDGPTDMSDGDDGSPEVDWDPMEAEDEVLSADSFQSGLYRELLPLEAGAPDDLEKPYLDALPETYAAEFLLFEWLEFLLLHAGFQGATEALQYYESVGWITDDVESTLGDYMLGIEGPPAGEENDLSMDDHKISLVYVAKLVSML